MENEPERFCHLTLKYSRGVALRSNKYLIKGTKEQIAEHIAKVAVTSIGNEEIQELRLMPVPSPDIFNLNES